VAQSVKHPTPDFGSSHDPRVMGPSPESGSVLGRVCLRILSLSLCPSLNMHSPLTLSPQRKKDRKKERERKKERKNKGKERKGKKLL